LAGKIVSRVVDTLAFPVVAFERGEGLAEVGNVGGCAGETLAAICEGVRVTGVCRGLSVGANQWAGVLLSSAPCQTVSHIDRVGVHIAASGEVCGLGRNGGGQNSDEEGGTHGGWR